MKVKIWFERCSLKCFLIELTDVVFLSVSQGLLKNKPNSHCSIAQKTTVVRLIPAICCDFFYAAFFIDEIKTILPLIYALLLTKSKSSYFFDLQDASPHLTAIIDRDAAVW